MKLAGRAPAEGTHPTIFYGHRVYRDPKTQRVRASRNYYAEWNEHGRKRYEALKTTNKQTAIRRVHQIAERIARGELPEPASAPLAELVKDYMATLRGKGRAPKTMVKYNHVFEDFLGHARTLKVVLARQYTETTFWKYSEHLIGKGLKPKTRYNYLVIVKQLFRWAVQNRRIAFNPVATAKLEEPDDSEQPVFTAEEVAMILGAADSRVAPVYTFLAYTGARFGEARDLRWDDVRLNEGAHGFIVISRGGSDGTTKSGRSRRIPCHPVLQRLLLKLPRHPTSPRVFHAPPSLKYPDGDGPIDERRMLAGLKRLTERLELPLGKQYKLHTFRHFFASMLAAKQVSYKYALQFMGHTSSQILDLYYKMYDPVAEEAILAVAIPAVSSGTMQRKGRRRRKVA